MAVTQRRTMEDFAHQMRWPRPPEVEVVRVVLTTHHRMAAVRGVDCQTAAYTPKHGSWLNMAEIEFSVLSRSCLRQRLRGALGREVQALVTERNTAQATINWRFNTLTPEPNCTASIPLIPNMTEY